MADLRAIDISREAPVVPADQPAPALLWVPVSELRVDGAYQRPLGRENWTHIRKIAAEFHWSRFGALQVAPLPGGGYAVVDGQHRAHAAAICGFDSVPALVVPMDRAEQARAFARVNGAVVKITPLQIYRAALAAGEDWAVGARGAVEAAGCVLMTFNKSAEQKKPGEVFAVGLIRRMVEAGEAEAVTLGLGALRRSSEGQFAEMWSSAVLGPWLGVLASSVRLMRADLDGFLARVELGELQHRARQSYAAARRNDPGASSAKALFAVLIEAQLRAHVEGRLAA